MQVVPYLLLFGGTAFLIVMTVAYYLVSPRIIARKSEYVKCTLVFLSAYAVLWSALHCLWVYGEVFLAYLFFPALFATYMMWPFGSEPRNQHIAFFLFWPALVSLPMSLLFLITLF